MMQLLKYIVADYILYLRNTICIVAGGHYNHVQKIMLRSSTDPVSNVVPCYCHKMGFNSYCKNLLLANCNFSLAACGNLKLATTCGEHTGMQ